MLTFNIVMSPMISEFLVDIIVITFFLIIIAVIAIAEITWSIVVTGVSMLRWKKQILSLTTLRSSWANIWNGDERFIVQSGSIKVVEMISETISFMKKVTKSGSIAIDLSKGIGDRMLTICCMVLVVVISISMEVVGVGAGKQVPVIVIAREILLGLGGKYVQARIIHILTASSALSSVVDASAPQSWREVERLCVFGMGGRRSGSLLKARFQACLVLLWRR